MVWSEAIHAMLLTHAKWRTFTERPLPPPGTSEVMLSLAMDNRELADPDGHLWGAFWMDPAAVVPSDRQG